MMPIPARTSAISHKVKSTPAARASSRILFRLRPLGSSSTPTGPDVTSVAGWPPRPASAGGSPTAVASNSRCCARDGLGAGGLGVCTAEIGSGVSVTEGCGRPRLRVSQGPTGCAWPDAEVSPSVQHSLRSDVAPKSTISDASHAYCVGTAARRLEARRRRSAQVYVAPLTRSVAGVSLPAIARAARRALNTQPPRNVPSSERLPCIPPPPKPAASPTA